MMRAAMVFATAFLSVSSAQAATVAIMATTDAHVLNGTAVQSVVWHALRAELGHDPLMLDGDLDDAHTRMKHAHVTTLLKFQVEWDLDRVEVDGGVLVDKVPTVRVHEYQVAGDQLALVRTWNAHGALALYRINDNHSTGYLAMPEVSLQEAILTALGPVSPPVWQTRATDVVQLPIAVCADDEYRAFYGKRWKAEATQRVDRASALLAPTGLALRVADYCDWQSPHDATTLKALLEDLASNPLPNGLLRVGFTQQMHLETAEITSVEDVGRAFQPGRDLVVADQALPPGHKAMWDEAEEAVAIAHEVLHTLGLPHLEQGQFLMSAVKSTTIHRVSPGSRSLARAAAEARYAHWDPEPAMMSLAHAAAAWIDEPDLQVEYIRENLARGPGVPIPGNVDPGRISALANVAISRHWLQQARTSPSDSALRKTVLAHTQAALMSHPDLAQPLIEALEQPSDILDVVPSPCRPGQADAEPGACLTR